MTEELQYQGVWQLEPDELRWIDDTTGYSCVILRHPFLHHLCGYVGVFPWHPAYGLGYNHDLIAKTDVHGGLTYAGDGLRNESSGDEWWLGFDCAHGGDLVPVMREEQFADLGLMDQCTYRTIEYVRKECTSLAQQLKQLEVVNV